MGSSLNIPQENELMVWIQLEDYKRAKDEIEKQLKRNEQFINEPINKFTKDTILHYAAYKQNNEIIEYLIHKGAKINLRNNRNLTPFDVCENEQIREKYLKCPD